MPQISKEGLLEALPKRWLVDLVALYDHSRETVQVWVECKDRKKRVKRDDIIKLGEAAADVRATQDAVWAPDELWFASTSGYDHDALKFAAKYQMRCFLLEDDRFVEIETG